MKLTASPEGGGVKGYPMSQFLSAHSLSYMARELACHSIAAYKDRFQGTYIIMLHARSKQPVNVDNCELLRVHCNRAAVETLLRKVYYSMYVCMYVPTYQIIYATPFHPT